MKKSIVLLSIISMFSAHAKTNYKYCNTSMSKLFQIADVEGQRLPHLFTIEEDGKLAANPKHAELDFYENSSDKMRQEYKFSTVTKSRGILSIFKSKDVDQADLSHSFVVQRDSKGRVMSVTKKTNCTDCKSETKVEVTYSKGRCVPKQIISKDLEGKAVIATDTLLCRDLIKSRRNVYKTIDKSNKCIGKMSKMLADSEKRLKSQLERLKSQSDKIDSQGESILMSNLNKMIELNKSLAEPLKKYSNLTDAQDESVADEDKLGHKSERLILLTSEVIGDCSKALNTDMLLENKVFKGLEFRKEDKPVLHAPDVQVINPNNAVDE